MKISIIYKKWRNKVYRYLKQSFVSVFLVFFYVLEKKVLKITKFFDPFRIKKVI